MIPPFEIPSGVTYDGPMRGLSKPLHLFTDDLTHSTFGVRSEVPQLGEIERERDAMREKFLAEAQRGCRS